MLFTGARALGATKNIDPVSRGGPFADLVR